MERWLDAADFALDCMIKWPTRENLQKTMPMAFQKSFGKKVAVILDCFKVFSAAVLYGATVSDLVNIQALKQ